MHIKQVVEETIKRKDELLHAMNVHGSPLYLFDTKAAENATLSFVQTFKKEIPRFHAYYAMKSNPHRYMLETVIKNGYGIDVSSGRELKLAVEAGSTDMIFTGPGKTDEELEMAIEHHKDIIVNIDSFGELRRLAKKAAQHNIQIRVGVRVSLQVHGNWNKFGIPLSDLKEFVDEAHTYSSIDLQGIQMHMSWNESVEPYKKAFEELSAYLKTNFQTDDLDWITYIDFGGGFLPQGLNGDYDLKQSTPEHMIYTIDKGLSLSEYAKGIGDIIRDTMPDLPSCRFFAEPGRIIATPSMYIGLRVVDVKKPGIAIIDGGNNIVGWERYETEYHPIVNLTHPSDKEITFLLYGSLCTPHDIWGYSCFAEKIEDGDMLVIPNQGAYTYTLAQNFIKDIPEVVRI